MVKRLRGGLWLELKKSPAAERPIETLKAPSKLYLPVRQSQGAEPSVCVDEGEHVYMGQPVAEAEDGASCAVHSPVSGVVESIIEFDHPVGGKSAMIVIANDGLDTPYNGVFQPRSGAAKSEDIIAAVKEAGVVSCDDENRPLWTRLELMADSKVKTVVINGVETDPYISVSQKIVDENPEGVIQGLELIMRCVGADKAIYAVSDDVPSEIVRGLEGTARISGMKLEVSHVPQKYPYGAVRYLMRQLFPHELEKAGKTDKPPEKLLHVGFVTPQDCVNVSRSVLEGQPELTRVITVAGDAVEEPRNLEVRIGSTVRDILECCGLSFDPDRVVLGSPMRGVAITSLLTPITKSVGAVLALKAPRKGLTKSICINCGKCAGVCPEGLLPNYIAMRAVKADIKALRGLGIDDCTECGCCAYICPGRMPIVELIKNIKKAAL